MENKIVELHNKIYDLEAIQIGAKPNISIDEKEKLIIIEDLWISNHYDEWEEETPSLDSVAKVIFDIILNENLFLDYQIVIQLKDTNGNLHNFNNRDFLEQ